MKRKIKVISVKNLPHSWPMSNTLAVGLFLDRIHAAGWVWGVMGTFYALIWICQIWNQFACESVDIFDEDRK